MSSEKPSAGDRDFLRALADVVFGNPFTRERMALIRRLAPLAPEDLTSDREALARVVAPKVARFVRENAIAHWAADDRLLLEPALLYVTYHRYVPQLDTHIERQANKSGEPLGAPFGEDAVRELVQMGFAEDRAARFFAFFFQLRRAFYFIGRALAGGSESMERLRQALWNNMFTHDMRGYEAALWNQMEDFSTLFLGETGTGKGSAAAAIGRSEFIPYLPHERRFATNFVDGFIAINLSQFPENLIESELFGHRKGAFTGAIDHHQGIFERCNPHGALFLDEIGEVSIPVQIKLLQVLQERTFTPVGGRERKRFSGRVIAASNQRLDVLRHQGRFRDDFFYRLCSDVIEVPTLRQRIGESPAEFGQLVDLLVARVTGGAAPELAARVLDTLERCLPRGYAWPGNVRELEQAVRRVLLTGSYAAHNAAGTLSEEAALVEKLRAGTLGADELIARYCGMLHRRTGSYAEVARITGLDPRTSRKYVIAGSKRF